MTVHDLRVFENGLASPADQKIIEENVRKAAAVVCSWVHPYQSLLERFPFAREKTFLIPLPVLNPGTARVRQQPNFGHVRLLTPGFITPHKNQEVIVRALAHLPNAIAVFTGAEDGRYGDELRALASELEVSAQIEWRGYIGTSELEDEYSKADLLVMPTRWEAASGPVFEAIARQLPFVASDIAPIRSQLAAIPLEAELFDCDSPDALVSAIKAAVRNYNASVTRLAMVSGPIVNRTWTNLAADYKRVFDFAAGTGPRPSDLMIGVSDDPSF
ncbi:glycosyltransferase family 4 protein [Microbacterium sp. W4I4]|uniref:glycosyltransferase family 4 protein n=1 Tax=Microbacterium sp. W4I4 TaxID=3042295 RepID=UPI0027D8DAB2|nr:glycosyltransferase family 4 protein [Microbacterium sp. W4I4]